MQAKAAPAVDNRLRADLAKPSGRYVSMPAPNEPVGTASFPVWHSCMQGVPFFAFDLALRFSARREML
jgi:hypothetical protein